MERETRLARVYAVENGRRASHSFRSSCHDYSWVASWAGEPVEYVKSTSKPALFLERALREQPPSTPKLNQEIPFAFRRAYGVSHRVANGSEKKNHGWVSEPGKFRSSSKKAPYRAYICSRAFEMHRWCESKKEERDFESAIVFNFFFEKWIRTLMSIFVRIVN